VNVPLDLKENIVKLNTNASTEKHQTLLLVILVDYAKMKIPVNVQESTLENLVNFQYATDMHPMKLKYAVHWVNVLLQTPAIAHHR
jgi:hypothetical protein